MDRTTVIRIREQAEKDGDFQAFLTFDCEQIPDNKLRYCLACQYAEIVTRKTTTRIEFGK